MSQKRVSYTEGQISLDEYLAQRPKQTFGGCSECICRNCLYWWSKRCPYGECWDDHQAVTDPYDAAHPGKPPRKLWSNWNEPGEQAHWCRGGSTYPTYHCQHFVKYKGQQVKTCLKQNVSVSQDGYILCGLVDSFGCEKCYEEFLKENVK